MKINEIQLVNIGPYRGNNTFDFRTIDGKNIILVGGENGAGKTTLLNAIKLGLFGSYGMGFKTESMDYYKKVKNILNNDAKKIGENNFRIKIEFSIVENYRRADYIFYRYWDYINNNLKENFEIITGGKHLTHFEKELFHSKLKEIMPPRLLDLCLFDGEEISRIVNEDLLSDYLKELSKVVFNLDLFETLEKDLETYSNQSIDIQKLEDDEQELYRLNHKEKEIKADIQKLIEELDRDKKTKHELLDAYKVEKHTFQTNGGLIKTEREKLLQEINKLEQERKHNGDQIKEFVTSLLPFQLCQNLLLETKNQLAAEESLHLFKQLQSQLSDDKLLDILSAISSESSKLDLFKTKLFESVKPNEDIILIHDASFSESSLIESMYVKVNYNNSEDIINLIEENKVKLTQLQNLKGKLKINDTTNEFSEIINRMEKLQENINQLDIDISNNTDKLTELMADLSNITKSIEKIQQTLNNTEKARGSYSESQKIIALSKHFRQIQNKKKLQEVQINASTLLKKILRKQNYISYILIDDKNYDIQLFDSNKELIEKATLSAGEKQILLISIIWAIFKSSGRKVPFIFDTLLGRLDKTHKTSILQYFIPYSGEQAIILSTDSEIDAEQYELLKPFISNEYMLDFNVNLQKTTIMEHYFPFETIGESL